MPVCVNFICDAKACPSMKCIEFDHLHQTWRDMLLTIECGMGWKIETEAGRLIKIWCPKHHDESK